MLYVMMGALPLMDNFVILLQGQRMRMIFSGSNESRPTGSRCGSLYTQALDGDSTFPGQGDPLAAGRPFRPCSPISNPPNSNPLFRKIHNGDV